jgi:hypothetical protein
LAVCTGTTTTTTTSTVVVVVVAAVVVAAAAAAVTVAMCQYELASKVTGYGLSYHSSISDR